MQINLTTPRKIVLQEEKSKTLETITVDRIVDRPNEKVVRVFIQELDGPIVLWEGDQYTAIGQWTDQQVLEKLQELYA